MKKIRITTQYPDAQGNQWAIRADAPRGGIIGDCLSFDYPVKIAGHGVYEVLNLEFTWHEANTEFVDPLMEPIRGQLRGLGCQKRSEWTEWGYCHELWYYSAYSAHDMAARVMPLVAKRLGWSEVITGYWPQDYPPA